MYGHCNHCIDCIDHARLAAYLQISMWSVWIRGARPRRIVTHLPHRDMSLLASSVLFP
jgi:hypothetical protein